MSNRLDSFTMSYSMEANQRRVPTSMIKTGVQTSKLVGYHGRREDSFTSSNLATSVEDDDVSSVTGASKISWAIAADENSNNRRISSSQQGSGGGGGSSTNGSGSRHDLLQLETNVVFGREEETLVLQEAFERMRLQPTSNSKDRSSTSGSMELILLGGAAGVGKSCLFESSLRNYASERGGTIAMGKYDQLQQQHQTMTTSYGTTNMMTTSTTPFPDIVLALQDICDLLPQRKDQISLRNRLKAEFASDLSLLVSIFPSLGPFLGDGSSISSSSSSNELQGNPGTPSSVQRQLQRQRSIQKLSTAQIDYMCRSFLKVVSTPIHPTILFLDDIHWADRESLDFLWSLVSQTPDENNMNQIRHCLLVGTYRNESEYQTEAILEFLRKIDEYSSPDIPSEPARGNTTIKEKPRNAKGTEQLQSISPKPESTTSQVKVAIRRISLTNLEHAPVWEMLTQILKLQKENTEELATLFLEKTYGQPFAVRQLLELLQVDGYLKRETAETSEASWQWDVSKIRSEIPVSANVATLLSQKINRLDDFTIQSLTCASCLGHCFEIAFVMVVVDSGLVAVESVDVESSATLINAAIARAIAKGLIIENCSKLGHYSFAHDIIQSCFYDRIGSDEDKSKMHLQIGRLLLTHVVESSGEKRIDTVVKELDDPWLLQTTNQLNRGFDFMTNERDQTILVKLNDEAGQRAAVQGATLNAATHLRLARKALGGEESWVRDFPLTLAVNNRSAEYEGAVGNFREADSRVIEILKHTNSMEDRLVALSVRADCLGAQGKLEESWKHSLQVLKEMGVKISKPKKMTILLGAMRVRRRLNSLTDQELLDYPRAKTAKNQSTMSFIKKSFSHAVLLGKGDHYALLIVRAMEYTLNHGFCNPSISALAAWGSIMSALRNIDEAFRFSKLSLLMARKHGAEKDKVFAMAVSSTQILHWRCAMKDLAPMLLDGYQRGMRCGYEEYAFLLGSLHIAALLLDGGRLSMPERARKSKDILQRMQRYNQDRTLMIALPAYQAYLNLMNLSDDPLILTGDDMDEEELREKIIQCDNVAAKVALDSSKMILASIFQNWKEADRWREICQSNPFANANLKSHYTAHHMAFFYGLVSAALLIDNQGQRKHQKQLTASINSLKKWLDGGKSDCRQYLYLLEAENTVRRVRASATPTSKIRGEYAKVVEGAYAKAIQAAEQGDFLLVKALANERFAIHLMEIFGESEVAAMYMADAHGIYWELGVTAKCEQLESHDLMLLTSATVNVAAVVAEPI